MRTGDSPAKPEPRRAGKRKRKEQHRIPSSHVPPKPQIITFGSAFLLPSALTHAQPHDCLFHHVRAAVSQGVPEWVPDATSSIPLTPWVPSDLPGSDATARARPQCQEQQPLHTHRPQGLPAPSPSLFQHIQTVTKPDPSLCFSPQTQGTTVMGSGQVRNGASCSGHKPTKPMQEIFVQGEKNSSAVTTHQQQLNLAGYFR